MVAFQSFKHRVFGALCQNTSHQPHLFIYLNPRKHLFFYDVLKSSILLLLDYFLKVYAIVPLEELNSPLAYANYAFYSTVL